MYVGESGCEARARAPSPSCATTHATGSPSARGARANARLAATGKALRAVPSGASPARTRSRRRSRRSRRSRLLPKGLEL